MKINRVTNSTEKYYIISYSRVDGRNGSFKIYSHHNSIIRTSPAEWLVSNVGHSSRKVILNSAIEISAEEYAKLEDILPY